MHSNIVRNFFQCFIFAIVRSITAYTECLYLKQTLHPININLDFIAVYSFHSSSIKNSFYTIFSDAITWIDAPENQFPTKGDDQLIKCVVKARPSPTVDWLYNGEVIRTNDHYVIETHALRIKNVKDSDEGIYTCRASVPQTGELQERNIRVEVRIFKKNFYKYIQKKHFIKHSI